MSILSDRDLAALYPLYRGVIGPASIDLAIGSTLLSWPRNERRDPRRDQSALWRPVGLRSDALGDYWLLEPHVRYLAVTRDPVRIPDDAAGFIGARSSWGRDGLAVIQGPAGYLDPGFIGNPTLELSVIGSELVLWPGACIAQLVIHELSEPSVRPYGHPARRSKYQGDRDATPSRTHLELIGDNDA